jgi:peroxiredoxin
MRPGNAEEADLQRLISKGGTDMRLEQGSKAPDFQAQSLRGETVSLEGLRGQQVLLKFYRFAACPLCSLHLRGFVKRADDLREAGIVPIIFFHSSKEKMEEQASLPMDLIPDPDKKIFRKYGVETSLGGLFSPAVLRDSVRATMAGFFSKPWAAEGGITGQPADFLVDGDGIIRHAHYGRHYSDSLTADQVLEIAKGTKEETAP